MALKLKKRGSINSLLLLISGIIILAGSFFTYIYVLRGVYGKFDFGKNFSSLSFGTYAVDSKDLKIAILYSKNTEEMLVEGNTWISDNVVSWKKTLTNYQMNYTVIQDSDVEKGRLNGYHLLIMPGTKSLSDLEYNQVKKFINDGGSILATSGAPGSYSDDKKWRGWEFFQQVFGLKFQKEISKEEISRIQTLRGGFPLTANIPTGYPLRLATWDIPIQSLVIDPRTSQIGFWYDPHRDTGLVHEKLLESCGIANGTYGKGRFVWLGFELNSVLGGQDSYIYLDRLLKNSLNWLLYRPIANVQDWPADYKGAAIILPIINSEPDQIANLLPILRAKRVKADFLIDPAVAESNPGIVKMIASYGDIGVILDIGYLNSVNDTINKLNNLNTQISKIKDATAKIKGSSNKDVIGVMPMFGLYDDNTVNSIAQTGLKYIFSDSLSDRSVPKVVIKGKNPIIVISKTARDDYEVIRDLGLTNNDFQVYTYNEDIEKLQFEGGLYVFKIHSNLQCHREYVNVVGEVIDSLRAKHIWVTTASELHRWWAMRNKVEMRVEQRSMNRVAVTISNSGKEDLSDFVVNVDLQVAVKDIVISSEIIGTKLPDKNYDPVSHNLEMRLKGLKAGESRLYFIDYSRVNG